MPEVRTPSTSDSMEKIKKTSIKSKKYSRILLLIVSYVIVGIVVWMIAEKWQADPAKQQERAQKEINKTIAEVGDLMILPEGEVPQVATIDDADSLSKTQAFFVGSKNGDKILLYVNAKKAIVYRPSEHKIVSVGPIVTDADVKDATVQAPKTNSVTPATTTSSKATSKDEE